MPRDSELADAENAPVVRLWYRRLSGTLETLYAGCGPCHDLSHAVRVATLGEKIGRGENADLDLVVLAALLHDCGHADAERGQSDDHEQRSAAMAAQALQGLCSADGLTTILRAISGRRFAKRHEPRDLVGRVLDDADNLDALGLTGVARAFLWIGEHDRRGRPAAADDPSRTAARPLENLTRHWQDKLWLLASGMRTPTGRQMAIARHRAMSGYIDMLTVELASALPRSQDASLVPVFLDPPAGPASTS